MTPFAMGGRCFDSLLQNGKRERVCSTILLYLSLKPNALNFAKFIKPPGKRSDRFSLRYAHDREGRISM